MDFTAAEPARGSPGANGPLLPVPPQKNDPLPEPLHHAEQELQLH